MQGWKYVNRKTRDGLHDLRSLVYSQIALWVVADLCPSPGWSFLSYCHYAAPALDSNLFE